MNKPWKEKAKAFLQKLSGYFAVYLFLPLMCGCLTGLFFLVNAVGAEKAQATFQSVGEQSVFTAVGAAIRREEGGGGFYFLSSDLIPPLGKGLMAVVGGAQYYSPVKEEILSPEDPKKPEILYDALPAGATPIISCDLSSNSFFINTTKYSIDLNRARASAFPSGVTTGGSDPLVLVLHTHGTECYFEDNTNLSDFAPDGVESYFLAAETSFRTQDPEKSVVKVGKVFVDTLNSLGIPSIHCTVMHDQDDFNDAYVQSAETVKAYLEKYPSIQYVIDLHRDSVVRGNSYVKSYASIEGKNSAQVMLVVGTNQNGRHPNWEKNLVVATAFKDSMDALFPSLSRSLYLRTARFNQEYLPGCMLLEVGSAVNTLEEAENAARFAARAFHEMLQKQQ